MMFCSLLKKETLRKLNEEDLIDFEKNNFSLPFDYKNLLNFQNGGYLLKNRIRGFEENIWINSLPGINGFDANNFLVESSYYIEEWSLPKDILLIYGEGHWWICFDFRKLNNKGEPKITYIDSELNKDQVIADSFIEFLNMLSL